MKQILGKTAVMLTALLCIFGVINAMGADGLNVTIEKAFVNDAMQPVVTFKMLDDAGMPIPISEVSPRFVFARLEVLDAAEGRTRYFSYVTTEAVVPEGYENAGASAVQATYDRNGTIDDLGGGRYVYTFEHTVGDDFANYAHLTHTVSGQFERAVGDKAFIANPLFHFVPDGSELTVLRKVITTEGCNACHSSLALHGGDRREVNYCIMCHQPQTSDPDTGNNLDMAIMIHKIHRGANLPSVQAGGQYKIVGYRQSTHDYSHVEFPQDIRNCNVCHKGPDADVYKNAPTRAVCGACHDNVNFQTGEGHGPGIPQLDDSTCTACHPSDGPEFGLSITGAHTIPTKSEALPGLNAEILEVSDVAPGSVPTIKFTMTQNDGSPVDISTLERLNVIYAGPSSDYQYYVSESMLGDTAALTQNGAEFTYLFANPLPDNVSGTLAFALESRRTSVIVDNPGDEEDLTAREALFNPVYYAAVTDPAPVVRRKVVDQNKCQACHDQLSLHGGQRTNVEYCVMCHNPRTSDVEERPEGVTGGESVSFSYMIHKIHKGEELNNPFLVFGHNSSEHDFTEILFPGNVTQCSLCHVQDVPSLPLPKAVQPIDFLNAEQNMVKIPPTTAACTSCHDNDGAIAHASLNTTEGGVESCSVCHMEGRDAAVIQAHADRSFLNVIETFGSMETEIGNWAIH